MPDIPMALIANLLGTGLASHGVTDDVLKTDAVSQLIYKLHDTINQQVAKLQGEVQQNQQKAAETNKNVQQLIKVQQALTEALQDKASPQPLPQQDFNAPEESAPAPAPASTPEESTPVEPPMPDAGMMPPPEMNVPPMPDAGMTPAPDMGGATSTPDMTQIDPNMLGALQQGY